MERYGAVSIGTSTGLVTAGTSAGTATVSYTTSDQVAVLQQ